MGVPGALGYAATVAALLLIGCDKPEVDVATGREVNELTKRLSTVEQIQQSQLREEHTALLEVGKSGFQSVRSDIGILVVDLAKVEASGPGVKIHLNIGNTTTADITKLRLVGSVYAAGKDGQMHGPSQQFDVLVTGQPRAGLRTPVSFVVNGVTPKDVGFVHLSSASAESILLEP